jgi:hypothetical protein
MDVLGGVAAVQPVREQARPSPEREGTRGSLSTSLFHTNHRKLRSTAKSTSGVPQGGSVARAYLGKLSVVGRNRKLQRKANMAEFMGSIF